MSVIFFVKKISKINWLNDIDNDLITTFKIISNSKERKKLIKLVSDFIPTRESFEELKHMQFSKPLDIAYQI